MSHLQGSPPFSILFNPHSAPTYVTLQPHYVLPFIIRYPPPYSDLYFILHTLFSIPHIPFTMPFFLFSVPIRLPYPILCFKYYLWCNTILHSSNSTHCPHSKHFILNSQFSILYALYFILYHDSSSLLYSHSILHI